MYSHTSMWPTQVDDLAASEDVRLEIQDAVSTVIRVAQESVANGDLQQRTTVFALFLAGVSSIDIDERVASIGLLKDFEEVSLGCNTQATRMLLEAVVRRKDELSYDGVAMHVDWMLMAQELGWEHLVNYGW